ncbi:hypothetical protein HELRODRAFT_186712 [Helobdella robusta]|uniref:Haloacid dehalogenase-like hydrolase domain-containing 5 n=1 Tax=Helobdella robusta TaxID=6412 RepID=T1FP24_HELRO|nr:hypothetical protein HELRODRAFT_186712 [Helobdella robusta]ESO10038.1 hypothetical protein HELRODRAFT_186712 [Helobdella robusta]
MAVPMTTVSTQRFSSQLLANLLKSRNETNIKRIIMLTPNRTLTYITDGRKTSSDFGLFFDIDGVITRGKMLLPHSKTAFKLLVDDCKKFKIPTIFVTNAGNSMRQSKANHLSQLLDIQIDADQVIMSHSPLRMFRQLLDKHMLVSGQGPTEEIAKFVGFSKVTTLEQFRHCFPKLDTNDYKRRKAAPCALEEFFPKIEGIVLFGEPVSWETSLQIIIDVLISDGRPSKALPYIPYPHLPILACNMDFVWMAEAPMPRFGHGCFMTCLETLYKKLTNNTLQYTAKLGKPSEITYHYAEHVLQTIALKMKKPPVKTMYCIGDNPATDIYGANLFNRRIQRLTDKRRKQPFIYELGKDSSSSSFSSSEQKKTSLDCLENDLNIYDMLSRDEPSISNVILDKCESILVCTGVFDKTRAKIRTEEHVMDESMCHPTFATVHNVQEAVQAVLERERML